MPRLELSFEISDVHMMLINALRQGDKTLSLDEVGEHIFTVGCAHKLQEIGMQMSESADHQFLARTNGLAAARKLFTPTAVNPEPPGGFGDQITRPRIVK